MIGQGSILPFTAEREVVDRDLNRRIAKREDDALGELYDRYGSLFYGFVVRLLRSVDDAEQLIHDHFQNFWNTPQRYPENRGTLYSQLIFAVRTQVVGRLIGKGQRRAVHGPESTVPLLVPERTGVHRVSSAIDESTVNSLVTALWALPPEQQRILALGWFDGFRLSEISERLSLPSDRVVAEIHEAISVITALFMDSPPEKSASHPSRYDSLSSVFALDLLDGNPRRDLEAHLRSGCVRCSDGIGVVREIAAVFPAILPQVRPPSELREKIIFSARLAQVAQSHYETGDKSKGTRPGSKPGPEVISPAPVAVPAGKSVRTAVLIAAVIVIAGLALYINYLHTVINEKTDYEKTLEAKIFLANKAQPAPDAANEVLSAPHLSILQLYGLGSRIMETGRILWSPDVQSAIVSSAELPPLANGQSYRLWFIRNNELHPGPLIACNIDPKNGGCTSYQKVGLPARVGDIDGVEVTRETEGDTTGKVVLFGKF